MMPTLRPGFRRKQNLIALALSLDMPVAPLLQYHLDAARLLRALVVLSKTLRAIGTVRNAAAPNERRYLVSVTVGITN